MEMTFFIIILINETRVYNNNITFVEMSEELGGGGGFNLQGVMDF